MIDDALVRALRATRSRAGRTFTLVWLGVKVKKGAIRSPAVLAADATLMVYQNYKFDAHSRRDAIAVEVCVHVRWTWKVHAPGKSAARGALLTSTVMLSTPAALSGSKYSGFRTSLENGL